MSVNLLQVVENMFETLDCPRLEELAQMIQQYNKQPDPRKAIRADIARIAKKVIEKEATAQEIYVTSPQSVCPCCRR